jgi:hypothetical protein
MGDHRDQLLVLRLVALRIASASVPRSVMRRTIASEVAAAAVVILSSAWLPAFSVPCLRICFPVFRSSLTRRWIACRVVIVAAAAAVRIVASRSDREETSREEAAAAGRQAKGDRSSKEEAGGIIRHRKGEVAVVVETEDEDKCEGTCTHAVVPAVRFKCSDTNVTYFFQNSSTFASTCNRLPHACAQRSQRCSHIACICSARASNNVDSSAAGARDRMSYSTYLNQSHECAAVEDGCTVGERSSMRQDLSSQSTQTLSAAKCSHCDLHRQACSASLRSNAQQLQSY